MPGVKSFVTSQFATCSITQRYATYSSTPTGVSAIVAFTNVNPLRRSAFPVPGGSKRPYTRKPPPVADHGDATLAKQRVPHVDPYSFGPRQPNLVGVGASTPSASPQSPAKPPAAPGAAAAVAGAKADALAQYVAGITDPKERAYVEAQIGPQIVALNAQRDALLQQDRAQQEAAKGFTQALIQQISGLDWSSPYAQIANSQVAAGKAAGESLAAANPQGGTADILAAIGAPESQVQSLEQLNRDVFSGGGAVLTGTGGTIPSFQTAGEGVGVLGYAAAQPTIAAAMGQEQLRQLLALESQHGQQYQSDLQSILAGIPKAQQDFQSQAEASRAAAEKRAMDLYNAGMLTQRDLARQLGLPNWQRYPNATRGDNTKPMLTTGYGGHRLAIDPVTGKITDLGPATAPKEATPKSLQSVTIGGKAYTFDPNTGFYYDPGTGRRAAPRGDGKSGGATKVNMPLSRSLGQWVDAGGRPIPALQNVAPPTPTSGLKPTAGGPGKPTAENLTKARQTIGQIGQTFFSLSANPDTPLSNAQLQKIVSNYNSVAKENGHKLITVAILQKASAQQLSVLGLTKASVTPQQAYLKAVEYGVPARQAWKMIRRKHPEWGQGYFSGKGSAVPSGGKTASYKSAADVQGAIGLVEEYLGTPYSWGGGGPGGPSYGIGRGANTKGFDCSALLQFMYSKLGIPIPRVTYDQWKTGTSVARKDLQPGDAVFFHPGSRGPEHVGIYIGGGRFIEAPYTGSTVRISSLAGRSDYMGARRYGVYA